MSDLTSTCMQLLIPKDAKRATLYLLLKSLQFRHHFDELDGELVKLSKYNALLINKKDKVALWKCRLTIPHGSSVSVEYTELLQDKVNLVRSISPEAALEILFDRG